MQLLHKDIAHASKNTSKTYRTFVFVLALFLIVLCGVIVFLTMRVTVGGEDRLSDVVEQQFRDTQLSLTNEIAAKTTAELASIYNTLKTLALTSEIRGGDTEVCTTFLKSFVEQTPFAIRTISRTNNQQLFDCANLDTMIGVDGNEFQYLNGIFQDPDHGTIVGREFVTSFVGESETFLTAMHVPITTPDGIFRGTIGSTIFFEDLMEKILDGVMLPDQSIVILSDDNSNILYHTHVPYTSFNVHDPSSSHMMQSHAKLEELFLQKKYEGSQTLVYEFEGGTDIASFDSVDVPDGSQWSMTITTPADRIDSVMLPVLRRMQQQTILIAGSAFISLLILLLLTVRWNTILKNRVDAQTQELNKKNTLLEDKLAVLAKREEQTEELLVRTEHNEAETKTSLKKLERTKRAMLNVMEDIQEEKEHSMRLVQEMKKFQLAVENTSDMIIISDAEGTILYANPATKSLSGYDPKNTIGTKCGALWGGHMDKAFYDAMWTTLKQKKVWTGQIMNRRKDGEPYYVAVTISPILDENDDILFYVDISRDVTKEKEIDKTKTEFVSLASHQLRTPLSTINWYAEMLLDGDVGALSIEQKKYVEEMYKGNQRMVGLVNALLNVSRIELGTFTIQPERVDIRELLLDMLAGIEPQIIQKQLNVSTKISRAIPEIQADPKLLNIVLENLLTNAIKYTPQKGNIEVSLKVAKKKKNGKLVPHSIQYIVSDNGMGIPSKQQEQIFTKLFRADNVKQTDTEGTGLGLYLVKSILDHTQGKISFISKEGKGTTFTVILPIEGMKAKKGTKELQ